jgi:type IV/VI secretion system ImpK/VasF family protein
MIGFADEFFLNFEWPYKIEWLNNLLEAKVFRTHISGSHIFEQIDYILEDRENTELARIYFYVLSFGFKGMHINNQPKIDQLKSQLFFMIYQQHPTTELNKLFETVIGESKTRKQYTAYHLLWFCGASLSIYLFVSYVIWYTYTDSLNQVIARFAL